jgi:SPP1 family predicted phage head-tail adaptor
MNKYDTIQLMGDLPEAHGVHDDYTPIGRCVYCEVKSVGRREAYEAMSHGYHPEVVFELAQAFEYRGEKRIVYQGNDYNIVRTYETQADTIELVAEKAVDQ